MESRKSIHKLLESKLRNSPSSSSPLRRKSIIAQTLLPNVILENNDEAERVARRRELCSSPSNKRYSLGLGFLANIPPPQMAESINECIKMSAENKINTKNAFRLEMIDFMTYMVKKQDDNMSNLQVASTSLDVSTKIYGFRVDSVHTDILKMIGGLDKQGAETTEEGVNEKDSIEDENADLEILKKKKKKKAKQKIFSTAEMLKGNIEILKPVSLMIGEGDQQTSDMLCQAILPNHANSGYYLHLFNDVLVDVVELESNSNTTKYTIPAIENFHNLEICESYSNFEFLDWSIENEPAEMPSMLENEHNDSNNDFQFNVNTTMEREQSPPPQPVNCFNIDVDQNEKEFAYGCYRQQAMAGDGENIVNAESAANSFILTTTNDYSFVLPTANLHWAGPTHWKLRHFTKSLTSNVNKVCAQAPVKKRKVITVSYTENEDAIDAVFALSQSIKVHVRTAKVEWCDEWLMLPDDIHYDIAQAIKLYMYPHCGVVSQKSDDRESSKMDGLDCDKHNYSDQNNTSGYCPNLNNNDYDDYEDNDIHYEDDDGALVAEFTQAFTGDNLVEAPKLSNRITIAYCPRAKRIDMRQLKRSIWSCLKFTGDTNNANLKKAIEQQAEVSTMKKEKQFSEVYKMLPSLLTKNNALALSVPLSFISLLHLANEKELEIRSLKDMSDIVVEKNQD